MTFCQTITKLYILRLFSCHCQKTPTCAALRERVEGAASEQLSSYPPHCLQSFHRRSILACSRHETHLLARYAASAMAVFRGLGD